ncbi:MAG: hypothetical protein U1F66_07790 [bacterium]
MNQTELQIIDQTLRESGFVIAHQWGPQEVSELAVEIERCGFREMEVCHGCGIGGFRRGFPGLYHDIDLLKAARKAAPTLRLSVYLDHGPHSLAELELIADHFDIGRVGVNVDSVDTIAEHLRKLKAMKKTAMAMLLRIHRFTPEQTAAAAERAIALGAQAIYLVDSYGSMDAAEVKEYLSVVGKRVSVPLGFQARNNTQRAIANSLAAVEAGVGYLDAALLGSGRDAGVANMTLLVALLQRIGMLRQLNLFEIQNATWWFLFPRLRRIPYPDLTDLLFAKHRIDFYPKEFIPVLSSIIEIPQEEFLLRIKSQHPNAVEIGPQELRDALAAEGIKLEVVMEYLQTGRVPGLEGNA